MNKRTTCLCLTFLLFYPSARAVEEAFSGQNFVGPDGHITPEAGLVYKLHDGNPTLRTYDTNYNGKLDPGEGRAMINKINADAAQAAREHRSYIVANAADRNLDPNQPMPLKDFERVAVIGKPKENTTSEHFRLRGSVSDFAKKVEPESPLSALSPAQFSYTRDFLARGNSWGAKGAIGGFWEHDLVNVSAGVEFDRLSSDVPGAKQVDALTLKILASNILIPQQPNPVAALQWNAGATYASNFDFEGGLLGFTADIEPLWDLAAFTGVASLRGVHDGISAANGPALGLRNFIRIEGGGTVDEFPGKPPADDEYLRAGPQFEASFWPFGTRSRLKMSAAYGNYAELLGDGPDFDNLSLGLEWRLDEQGHFILKAEYNNGRVPLLLTERETLLLSLGVRF